MTEEERLERQLDEVEQLTRDIALVVSNHGFSTIMCAMMAIFSGLARSMKDVNEQKIAMLFAEMRDGTIADMKHGGCPFKMVSGDHTVRH